MATNLRLDDALVERARRAGNHRSKKEAVTAALEEYVRCRSGVQILELAGKIEFDPTYDYKKLRTRTCT